jgi:hypothetical protein
VRISADGAKPAQIARVRRRCEGEGGYMEEEGDCGQSRRKKGAVMGETAGAGVSGYCDETAVYPGGDGGTERGHGVGSSNGRGQGPVLEQGRRRGPAPVYCEPHAEPCSVAASMPTLAPQCTARKVNP